MGQHATTGHDAHPEGESQCEDQPPSRRLFMKRRKAREPAARRAKKIARSWEVPAELRERRRMNHDSVRHRQSAEARSRPIKVPEAPVAGRDFYKWRLRPFGSRPPGNPNRQAAPWHIVETPDRRSIPVCNGSPRPAKSPASTMRSISGATSRQREYTKRGIVQQRSQVMRPMRTHSWSLSETNYVTLVAVQLIALA